jgi:hypothetical protein
MSSITSVSSAAAVEPAGVSACAKPGCELPALIVADDLSYAADHFVLECVDGHRGPVPTEAA